MTEQHPITPPLDLVNKWGVMLEYCEETDVFSDIARWGADQELEACCEWLDRNNQWARCDIDELHDGRRPKPQSLKEQALKILEEEPEADDMKELIVFDTAQVEIIRRALEALPE